MWGEEDLARYFSEKISFESICKTHPDFSNTAVAQSVTFFFFWLVSFSNAVSCFFVCVLALLLPGSRQAGSPIWHTSLSLILPVFLVLLELEQLVVVTSWPLLAVSTTVALSFTS